MPLCGGEGEDDGAATGYVVRRATQADGPYEILQTGFVGTQCGDTRLPADVAFRHTVQAANDGGLGPVSTSIERPVLGPREADSPADTVPGLIYEYYEGDWNRLPDFGGLTAEATGAVSAFHLPPHQSEDAFGFRLRGCLDVPTDGEYTFFLASDEGRQLLMGEDVVVDNDGTYGTEERPDAIPLRAGKRAIAVLFFGRDGGGSLRVEWSGPDIDRQPVPEERLPHVE